MHDIYWVVSRDCNQRCQHCYNDSEPGAPGLTEEEASRCIANFPKPDQVPVKILILSGGEVLVWPELLFHTLRESWKHFEGQTELVIQTNGDLLDEAMLARLLDHHVTRISVASIDDYHKASTRAREQYLHDMLLANGLEFSPKLELRDPGQRKPSFNIWGMTDDKWVGKLWPRGRARHLGLSRATPDTNFCGNWSGAKGFLDYQTDACEVSIQLADVYPCCPMTCRPIGDLVSESLISMLDRCATHPLYRALNEGAPERMGEYMGLSESFGVERTKALGNHCLWCDEFFTKYAPDQLYQKATPTARNGIDLTIQGKRYKGVHRQMTGV